MSPRLSSTRVLGLLAGLGVGLGLVTGATSASAQGAGGAAPAAAPAAGPAAAPAAGGGASAGGGTGGGASAGGVTTGGGTTVVFPQYPNAVVAPVPEGGVLGGGNVTGSSSKPITGPGDRDGFDLQKSVGGGSVRGRENASFVFGGTSTRRNPNTTVHSVRKGDTLWRICDEYFQNPYQWPRIWSYNPEIQNPHWIYPGEQVRLRPGADVEGPPGAPGEASIRGAASVPAGTVFLRNEGYVEDQANNWGEINGSPEDKMLLTEGDEVYIRFSDNREVKEGQLLTIYRPQGTIRGSGQLVAIQGTVRVDNWRPKDHTARARIVEATDVIERGARIGPIKRRFEVVPPVRNDAETAAQVVASVRTHSFYGQDQVVFIDKGEDAKVKPGNRLLVLRKGDAWHDSFKERRAVDRIALESESPAATEPVPRPKDLTKLPEEIVGELRVISVGKTSSMCLFMGTRREIEIGDKVFLRKGY